MKVLIRITVICSAKKKINMGKINMSMRNFSIKIYLMCNSSLTSVSSLQHMATSQNAQNKRLPEIIELQMNEIVTAQLTVFMWIFVGLCAMIHTDTEWNGKILSRCPQHKNVFLNKGRLYFCVYCEYNVLLMFTSDIKSTHSLEYKNTQLFSLKTSIDW